MVVITQVIPMNHHRQKPPTSSQEVDLETVTLHEILVTLEASTVLPPKLKWPLAQRFFGASSGVFGEAGAVFLNSWRTSWQL